MFAFYFPSEESAVVLRELVHEEMLAFEYLEEGGVVLEAQVLVEVGEGGQGVLRLLSEGVDAEDATVFGQGQHGLSLSLGCNILYDGKGLAWFNEGDLEEG